MKILTILIVAISFIGSSAYARKNTNQKIIYKYKKYQKFDFEAMSISGDASSPGDLSIRPRKQKGFKNMLPFRRNFNSQLRRSIERIR